jgi:glycosyltransferase involved in cell wall biosynthesis
MIDNSLDVTFVVPCLNEAANIAATLETIRSTMCEFRLSYEILVIDDGSTDGTACVVEEYRLAHPEIELRLHKNPKNLGLATSFVNGAFLGKGKYFKLISGDNAEPKESLVKVFSHLGEADMLVAHMTRVEGKSVFRMGLSNLYTFLINLISGYRLKYYNGAAVHLRYNVMRWGPYSFGFGFQAELITKLLDEGASYIEIPVLFTHRQKSGGNSALNLKNFLSVCHTLLELMIRRLRRRTIGR